MMELDVRAETETVDNCSCSRKPEAGAESACSEKPQASNGEGMRRAQGPDRRLDRVERRLGFERRKMSAEESGYSGPERRIKKEEQRRTGLERRRGPGRRLSDDRKSAEEGEMSELQFEFVMAVQTYKKVNKKMYPTWTEILEIINQLGYRKVLARKIKLETPEPGLYQG